MSAPFLAVFLFLSALVMTAAENLCMQAQSWINLEEYTGLYLEEGAAVALVRCLIEEDALRSGTYGADPYTFDLEVTDTAVIVYAPSASFEIIYDPESGQLLDCTAYRDN